MGTLLHVRFRVSAPCMPHVLRDVARPASVKIMSFTTSWTMPYGLFLSLAVATD